MLYEENAKFTDSTVGVEPRNCSQDMRESQTKFVSGESASSEKPRKNAVCTSWALCPFSWLGKYSWTRKKRCWSGLDSAWSRGPAPWRGDRATVPGARLAWEGRGVWREGVGEGGSETSVEVGGERAGEVKDPPHRLRP